MRIAGKGQNETLEIAIPMEHTTATSESVKDHVPENGAHVISFLQLSIPQKSVQSLKKCSLLQSMEFQVNLARTSKELCDVCV
jgi:hypothetical protein